MVQRGGQPVRQWLDISSLDVEGRGVARNAEGKVVFVEGALPGERVLAEQVRRKPRFDLMRAVELRRESSARRKPACPNFGVCGGCATQHIDSRMQIAAKQRWLEENLRRIGGVTPQTVLAPVRGADWGYRHRARLTVRYVAKKGGVLVGFHERRSSYVADMGECLVLPPHVSALLRPLRDLVEALTLRERLPQIELAVGDRVTVLVLRILDPLAAQDDAILREFAGRHDVDIWLQTAGPDTATRMPGLPERVLDYALPEFDVRIGFRPTDFTQVNHAVNRVLVARALRLLDPRPGERVGDFFCGLGNFTLPIARCGASVLGVEGSESLLERARANAQANALAAQVRFEAMNLFEIDAARLAAFGPLDRILIDPPRDGAAALVGAIGADGPHRIVYVSCDPATLARDAGSLVRDKGYVLRAAGVVNMFAHTTHVESIAVFDRA